MTTVYAKRPATGRGRTPARGGLIHDFSAPTPDGTMLRPRDVYYLRRNLALVFTHGLECGQCRNLLRDLAKERALLRAEDGEILAVVPGDREAAGQLEADLKLCYPVVVDEDGSVYDRYRLLTPDGAPKAAIFTTDRYGTVFEVSIANDAHEMMPASDVPGWLEFIACEC